MTTVVTSQSWGPGRQGGFLRILGIIYLVKVIRRRRERRQEPGSGSAAS